MIIEFVVVLVCRVSTYFLAILVVDFNPTPITTGKCVAGYANDFTYRLLRERTYLLSADVVGLDSGPVHGNKEY